MKELRPPVSIVVVCQFYKTIGEMLHVGIVMFIPSLCQTAVQLSMTHAKASRPAWDFELKPMPRRVVRLGDLEPDDIRASRKSLGQL